MNYHLIFNNTLFDLAFDVFRERYNFYNTRFTILEDVSDKRFVVVLAQNINNPEALDDNLLVCWVKLN